MKDVPKVISLVGLHSVHVVDALIDVGRSRKQNLVPLGLLLDKLLEPSFRLLPTDHLVLPFLGILVRWQEGISLVAAAVPKKRNLLLVKVGESIHRRCRCQWWMPDRGRP